MTDLYRLLGAAPHATHDELHQAYRARARELHPDVSGDEEAMRALNDAWAVLGDPALRAEYDELLGLGLGSFLGPDGGGVEAPGCARRAPLIAILVVLLAIFVITAYVAVPTGRQVSGRPRRCCEAARRLRSRSR